MTTPNVGDHVVQVDGPGYRFAGQVLAVFKKLDGHSVRVAVENEDGRVEVFAAEQLVTTERDPEFGPGVII